MVEKPAVEVDGGSTVQDTTLVVISTSLMCPPPVGQSSDNQRLEDDVVLDFDDTHRLSKLTTAWEGLSAGVASFVEQLRVGIFFFLFLVVQLLLLFFSFPFFFL
jgi:hypothetical protein